MYSHDACDTLPSIMTERFIDIERDDMPAVFEIGVGENGTTLKISVHSSIAGFIEERTGQKEIPIAKHLEKKLRIPKLVGFSATNQYWGFGEVMLYSPSERPEWVTWNCELPKKQKTQDNIDWTKLFAVSATLKLLSRIIAAANKDKGDTRPQLFELMMTTERDLNGGSLSVKLARAFIPWISSQVEREHHPRVEPPMRNAYEYMTGSNTLDRFRFNAWFRPPKWVNLSVSGNACGLDPEDYSKREPGSGYELLSHNVDGPVQQLSLLMGIAAMHDEARK